MGYVKNNLMNGETIIIESKLHKIIFLGPLIFAVLVFLASLLFLIASTQEISVRLIGFFMLLLSGLILLAPIIKYKTSEFAVTNKRVVVKTGFIERNAFEILLKKVEGINIQQGVIGRIFKYGSIMITGTGGSKNIFYQINDPFLLQRAIQEQVDKAQL